MSALLVLIAALAGGSFVHVGEPGIVMTIGGIMTICGIIASRWQTSWDDAARSDDRKSLRHTTRTPHFLLFTSYFLLPLGLIALGLARPSLGRGGEPDALQILAAAGTKVELAGTIVHPPEPRDRGTDYVVEITSFQTTSRLAGVSPAGATPDRGEAANEVSVGRGAEPPSEFLLLHGPLAPVFQLGDELEISGKLRAPEGDWGKYLERRDISAEMSFPRVRKVGEADERELRAWRELLDVRERLRTSLDRALREPESSLARGILLGDRANFPDDFQDALRATGLVHLVAVSGYNVTLVAAILMFLTKPLGRRLSVGAGIFGIALFVLVSGMSAAAVRAGVMGALGLLALGLGRQAEAGRLLILSVAALGLWDPRYLTEDLGFQLSVLATSGLIWIVPIFESWWRRALGEPGKSDAGGALRGVFLATMAAQVAAVPLLVVNFEQLSLISPVANLLVEPTMPLAMLGSFLTAVLGSLSEPLGRAIGLALTPLLGWTVGVAETLGNLPGGAVPAALSKAGATLWYVGFAAACAWSERRRTREMAARM